MNKQGNTQAAVLFLVAKHMCEMWVRSFSRKTSEKPAQIMATSREPPCVKAVKSSCHCLSSAQIVIIAVDRLLVVSCGLETIQIILAAKQTHTLGGSCVNLTDKI